MQAIKIAYLLLDLTTLNTRLFKSSTSQIASIDRVTSINAQSVLKRIKNDALINECLITFKIHNENIKYLNF